ncbi:ROK family transcriptional regulator [Leifsonia aquatica]|uniref:ROK family transcriptional regulator n=1 Tax=Leifsonia aquatica TaxID=144185 RepID=UPI00381017C4
MTTASEQWQGRRMPKSTPWLRDSPGAVFSLFREHVGGLTKSEVVRLTGLSRTAISSRVDALTDRGFLVAQTNDSPEGRGRPAERFVLNPGRGVFLVADTGATGMRAGLFDAAGTLMDEMYEAFDIASGPEVILARVDARFVELLSRTGVDPARVLGIGIDLPGPVDQTLRRVIRPPIMPGWHNFDIPGYFQRTYDCPVIVEKDTNAMAFGEHRKQYPEIGELMFVKLGTGVGTGLIVRGDLYRGADGAAGDIGHIPVAGDHRTEPPRCRCGNVGCVEAYAGGWALARDLSAAGYPASSINDVITAVRSGNEAARELVRRASQIIGEAVSDIVHMVNPRVVVFGGQLAELDEIVLATVREVIYGRALPLATRNLQVTSMGIDDPGVYGLAELVADEVFSIASIDSVLLFPGRASIRAAR